MTKRYVRPCDLCGSSAPRAKNQWCSTPTSLMGGKVCVLCAQEFRNYPELHEVLREGAQTRRKRMSLSLLICALMIAGSILRSCL